jgi:V/A-type H+/Na+-transporting ATPase subunit I
MIVRMKKVTIAVLASTSTQTLEDLRGLGILHVKRSQTAPSDDIQALSHRIERVESAIDVLGSRGNLAGERETPHPPPGAEEVLEKETRRREIMERLGVISLERERLSPLGDFSLRDLQTLSQSGLTVKLYQCRPRQLKETPIPVPHAWVGSEGSIRYILAVDERDFDLPFEEMALPEKDLKALDREAAHLEKERSGIEEELGLATPTLPSLRKTALDLREELEFAQVVAGMGRHGEIQTLQGFCPAEEVRRIHGGARHKGWGLLVEDIPAEEEAPTLIRNPFWIRIIQPVYRFLGTLPGYGEFDVSFWFLASLSLFFAMLVGDGGYGVFFFLVTFLLRRRFSNGPVELFVLFYVFSTATILWGLLSGTWFGIEAFSRSPLLRWAIIPSLYSYADNQEFMIRLCFTLGVLHLTIAHLVKGTRKIRSLSVLSELGWIAILWGLFFLADYLVLGKPMPALTPYLLLSGVFLAAVFSNPRKSLLRSALAGFADLPLRIINSFSDLVSYIRLFAVGYATLVVATSFNQMAAGIGWEFSWGIPAFLIALLGHGMNLLLALMAVIVHGVRLNMLEFSSHLGMGWTGYRYDPFRRRGS